MTTVYRSWVGTMLVVAGITTAIVYRARKPDYESVRVPELRICKKWATAVRADPGTFQLVDCETGESTSGFYLVGGRLFQPDHVSLNDYDDGWRPPPPSPVPEEWTTIEFCGDWQKSAALIVAGRKQIREAQRLCRSPSYRKTHWCGIR